MKKSDTIIRFQRSYTVSSNGCWNWILCKDKDGYGFFGVNGRNVKAHRYAFERFRHPLPLGSYVLHHCDNRACVNPDHLYIGTAKDNRDDCIRKKRHGFGESYVNAKLTEKEAYDILQNCTVYDRDLGIKAFARKYGVSQNAIRDIITRRTWTHLVSESKPIGRHRLHHSVRGYWRRHAHGIKMGERTLIWVQPHNRN